MPATGQARLRALAPALMAVIAALALAACGSGSSGTKLPPLRANVAGPITMFTPSQELVQNPAGVAALLRALGVNTVHLYVLWNGIAPDPTSRTMPAFNAADPAAYPSTAWAPYDAAIREVYRDGMHVILDVIGPPPYWASAPGAPHPAKQTEWEPSPRDFGAFMHALGVRYSGHYVPSGAGTPLPRVGYWSIWNEPNLGFMLAPETRPHTQIEVAPRLYRGLLNEAWTALHATGHGGDQTMIGELAPLGATFAGAPGLFSVMTPLRFLRALYCVDANYRPLRGAAATERGCPPTAAGSAGFVAANPLLFKASSFAIHPYTQGLAPNVVTPNEPDFAELSELPRLGRTLDTLQRVYGSHVQFPIYNTEYGFQTSPPDPEPVGPVPLARASAYLNWSEYLTWLNPRIKSYDQYLLYDRPDGLFATGLLSPSGAPKPTLAAFRMPIWLPVSATSKGSALLVWGEVRPARFAALDSHRTQRVQIQFARAGQTSFRTVRTVPLTGPNGYFEVDQIFPGSGSVRLAWSYPRGPEVYSRTVAITVR